MAQRTSAFYRELEKRSWIGPAINAALYGADAIMTTKDTLSSAKLETPTSMQKYVLGPPSEYKYGISPRIRR